MVHLLHLLVKRNKKFKIHYVSENKNKEEFAMSMKKHFTILTFVIVIAAVLGRLAVRMFLNILLGGTLFGGDFL
jgi:hypothetical protein